MFEFSSPYFLFFLALVPIMIFWILKKSNTFARAKLSSVNGFVQNNLLSKFRNILQILRILSITFFIIALSGPRESKVSRRVKNDKGIDIIMAIDLSASMLSRDLKPNRLEALKKIAVEFVNRRKTDRIGIVTYAGEGFTRVPVTSDHNIVKNIIKGLKYGFLEGGTAIGIGLGTAINRLKSSKSKSKVIILLTDGVNNTGEISPITASEIAKEKNIKVYTIGLGKNGYAKSPVAMDSSGRFIYDKTKVEIDESVLQKIADKTGGKYFRATSVKELKNIYNEIDKLEKTEYEDFKYYKYTEMYRLFLLIGLVLLFMEIILRLTLFKSFV